MRDIGGGIHLGVAAVTWKGVPRGKGTEFDRMCEQLRKMGHDPDKMTIRQMGEALGHPKTEEGERKAR